MKFKAVPALLLASVVGISALAISNDANDGEKLSEQEVPEVVGKHSSEIRTKLVKELRRIERRNRNEKAIRDDLRARGIKDFDDLCADIKMFPDYYPPTMATLAVALACEYANMQDVEELVVEDGEEVREECSSDGDCELVVVGTYDLTASDFLLDNDCPVSDEWCSSINMDGVELTCSLQVLCKYDTVSGHTYSCQYTGDIDGVDVAGFDSVARFAFAHEPSPHDFCQFVADKYMAQPVGLCDDDELSLAEGCESDDYGDFAVDGDDDVEDEDAQGCVHIGNGEVLCEEEFKDVEEDVCTDQELTYEDYLLLNCDPKEW